MKTLSPYYFHAPGKLVKPDNLAILSIKWNDKSRSKRHVFSKQTLIVFQKFFNWKRYREDYHPDGLFFFFKEVCRLVSEGIGIVVDQPEQSYPRYHAHGGKPWWIHRLYTSYTCEWRIMHTTCVAATYTVSSRWRSSALSCHEPVHYSDCLVMRKK